MRRTSCRTSLHRKGGSGSGNPAVVVVVVIMTTIGGTFLSGLSTGGAEAFAGFPLVRSRPRTVGFASAMTELPDSLDDAAVEAAAACGTFWRESGGGDIQRCRVDFDTSAGDETYTKLKSSTEFVQKLCTALCEDRTLFPRHRRSLADETETNSNTSTSTSTPTPTPTLLVYFPDEGNAALAERDWRASETDFAKVPDNVRFAAVGSVNSLLPLSDGDDDDDVRVILYFCPKASEADAVEQTLQTAEQKAINRNNNSNQLLTIFVNPLLVDMGVTGFGLAGRRLRERLLDGLVPVYYLRTLSWGAVTRVWPRDFTVWQEDPSQPDGYAFLATRPVMPSNPEVEDIYDMANANANGGKSSSDGGSGLGFLDALGDFVTGMTRL